MKTKLVAFFFLIFSVSLISCDQKKGESKALYDTANVSASAAGAEVDAAKTAPKITSISFQESEHDFGTIDEGIMASHTFKFTNTGSEPLIISDARADCGCTVPSWTKEPIMPGAEGKIDVKYNSSGKSGQTVSKTVTVLANTDPSDNKLIIKAKVRSTGASPLKQ